MFNKKRFYIEHVQVYILRIGSFRSKCSSVVRVYLKKCSIYKRFLKLKKLRLGYTLIDLLHLEVVL